jgi:hypothetical protein
MLSERLPSTDMHTPISTTAGDAPILVPDVPVLFLPHEEADDILGVSSRRPSGNLLDLPPSDSSSHHPPAWTIDDVQAAIMDDDQLDHTSWVQSVSQQTGQSPKNKQAGRFLNSASMPDLKLVHTPRQDVFLHPTPNLSTSDASPPSSSRISPKPRHTPSILPETPASSVRPVRAVDFPLPPSTSESETLPGLESRSTSKIEALLKQASIDRHPFADVVEHVDATSRHLRKSPSFQPDETIYSTKQPRPPPLHFYYPPSNRVYHPTLVVPRSSSDDRSPRSAVSTFASYKPWDLPGSPQSSIIVRHIFLRHAACPNFLQDQPNKVSYSRSSRDLGRQSPADHRMVDRMTSFMDMTTERASEKNPSNMMRTMFSRLTRKLRKS